MDLISFTMVKVKKLGRMDLTEKLITLLGYFEFILSFVQYDMSDLT